MNDLSVSFVVDKLHRSYGGVGGNLCFNLGLLGLNPICFTSCGRDFGEYREFLLEVGVDVSEIVQLENEYTSSYVVFNDEKERQISAFYPGALSHDLNLSLEKLTKKSDFVMIAPTMPEAMLNHARFCKSHKIRYAFLPGQQTPNFSREYMLECIEGAEILFGNQQEIAMLKGKVGLEEKDLLDRVKILVTTQGSQGSKVQRRDEEAILIGVAKPEKVSDPTGAGDGYAAGFLAGYLREAELKKCAQMGATVAAFVVEKLGTTNHFFDKDLLSKRVKENFA
jgi:adenosine kinase